MSTGNKNQNPHIISHHNYIYKYFFSVFHIQESTFFIYLIEINVQIDILLFEHIRFSYCLL